MTRVLLLGTGPLPSPNLKRVDFPMLRTWQFLRGLLAADLDVWLVQSVTNRGTRTWHEHRLEHRAFHVLLLPEDLFDHADAPARWVDQCRPDVVVSAGPFRPARAASRIPRGIPTLIDLPGDPMAEAQLRTALTGDDSHLEHARRLMDAVLWRGDAFSVVSHPQRHAMLGALGLVGRLPNPDAFDDALMVVPVGTEPLWQTWAGKPGTPRDKHKVVWPGSFNTWAAVDTFVDACETAMAENSSLHVTVTGGPIKDHAEAVHAHLVSRIAASRWPHRWRLTGWIDAERAAEEVRTAAVGIMLDRPCAESELGSRTRLLYGAVLGLPWIVTARCELAQQLVALGAARPVTSLDPKAVAEAILEATARSSPARGAESSLARLYDIFGIQTTMAPLVAWVRAPAPLPAPSPRLQDASTAHLLALERTLSEIHHSITWRTLAPIHRIFISLLQRRRRGPVSSDSFSENEGSRTASAFVDETKKDH